MGLRHPQDLEQWRRWERPSGIRRAVAAVRRRGRPAPTSDLRIVLPDGPARLLVALDSATPSSRAAVLEPARRLDQDHVAYLGPAGALERTGVAADASTAPVWDPEDPRLHRVERVLSIGAALAAGHAACTWAAARGLDSVVVQHGLLTPWAPPLPADTTLLSFTAEDGAFWASGRRDITVLPVGSQAMWEAAASSGPAEAAAHRPLVFLGQLHGRELPRREIVGQTVRFLRRNPQAVYRPHPSETDLLSRAIHAAMLRSGTRFQETAVPLARLQADAVSVFSTGVLEAAQRGRRAWVHHDDPPPWLEEVWRRYGLARWGEEPTAPVRWSDREPAETVAEHLRTGEPR